MFSGDFINKNNKHDINFITFKVKYLNINTHGRIPTNLKEAISINIGKPRLGTKRKVMNKSMR